MIWPILFSIGLAQGIFLVCILAIRKGGNRLAARLLTYLLLFFVLSNYDDLLLASGWYAVLPWSFGTSLAAFFAYGPLFYLYTRAVTDPQFVWRRTMWWHFLPFFGCFLIYLPILLMPATPKGDMLRDFLAGKFSMQFFDMAIALIKTVHFGSYFYLSFRQIKKMEKREGRVNLQVPFRERAKWLNTLLLLFFLIFLALAGLTLFNIINNAFVQNMNFGFTLITCSCMYFIAYNLIFRAEIVTPDFKKKYATQQLQKPEVETLLLEIDRYLDAGKIFDDPELNLRSMATELKTSPHRLSMVINDKFGQSFSDFINKQRVEEFIHRLNDPRYAHFTMYGLALELGFNSKSAFNAAFKKFTGKTPSDFKK